MVVIGELTNSRPLLYRHITLTYLCRGGGGNFLILPKTCYIDCEYSLEPLLLSIYTLNEK